MAKHLTKDEMDALALAAQKGNVAAQNQLIEANMGLCYREAGRHKHFSGTNREDLAHEGAIGMIEAIKTFDHMKGVKFTTYAMPRVRMRILNRAMADHRMVKIGTSEAQRKLFWNLNKEEAKCLQEGIEPTSAVLADRLGVTVAHVEEMQIRMGGGAEDSLSRVVKSGDEGNGLTLFDTVANGDLDPDAYATEQGMRSWMLGMMDAFSSKLTGPPLAVWNERIAAHNPDTLQVVADTIGLSRQRVQQIESDLRSRFTKFARNRA